MTSKRDQLLNIMEDAAKGETKAALRKEIAALKAENERLTKEWEAAGLAAKQRQDEIDKLRALAERAGGVKVKALEWEMGVVDWAKPLPGMKYVACSTTPAGSWAFWLEEAPETRAVFSSEAEAKAAAQADYERRIVSAITTEPAAPEVRQEVEPVGYLFRLRYGPDRWSNQDMFSDCLPTNPDDVKDVRPLYARPAEQAVTEAMVSAALKAHASAYWSTANNGEGAAKRMRAALEAALRGDAS